MLASVLISVDIRIIILAFYWYWAKRKFHLLASYVLAYKKKAYWLLTDYHQFIGAEAKTIFFCFCHQQLNSIRCFSISSEPLDEIKAEPTEENNEFEELDLHLSDDDEEDLECPPQLTA